VTVVLPPPNAVFEKNQEPSDTINVADIGDSGGSKGAGSCRTVGVLEFTAEVEAVVEGDVEEVADEEVFDSANLGLDSDL